MQKIILNLNLETSYVEKNRCSSFRLSLCASVNFGQGNDENENQTQEITVKPLKVTIKFISFKVAGKRQRIGRRGWDFNRRRLSQKMTPFETEFMLSY